MDQAEWIKVLNEDIAAEHAAIVQYLRHAFAAGETALGFKLKEMAREEMWHLDWLSDYVADELGATPSIERGTYAVDLSSHGALFRSYVVFEDNVVATYKTQEAQATDPELKRILHRIIVESETHSSEVAAILTELGPAADEPPPALPPLTTEADPLVQQLDFAFRDEYKAILQYLRHSFIAPNCPFSRQMFEQAVDEMRHLDWLAEELEEHGYSGRFEHAPIDTSRDMSAMARSDLAGETDAASFYSGVIGTAAPASGLRALITLIRTHEDIHAAQLRERLEQLKPAASKLTVGSLKE